MAGVRDRGGALVHPRWLLPAAVIALFVVMVVAAAWQGVPHIGPSWVDGVQLPEPTQQPQPTVAPPAPSESQADTSAFTAILALIVQIVLRVVLAAVLLVLLVLIARAVRRRWPRALRAGATTDATDAQAADDAAVRIDAPAVRRGIDGALARIDDHREPSDAIIAAWVGLEESADDAGWQRGPSETPGEFTVRLLGHRSDARADIATLLRLYERVRFGGWRADDADRAEARAALERIRLVWE